MPSASVLGPSAPPTSWFASPPVVSVTPGISTPRLNMLRPAGERGHDLGVHDGLTRGVLQVHRGRFAGDGDEIGNVADRELAVERAHERAGQFDVLEFLRRLNPCSENVTVYVPGQQFRDAVDAARVADRGSDLLNQYRAGGFDGHTGQHAARRVAHDAGDGRSSLGERRPGQREHERDCPEYCLHSPHGPSSLPTFPRSDGFKLRPCMDSVQYIFEVGPCRTGIESRLSWTSGTYARSSRSPTP